MRELFLCLIFLACATQCVHGLSCIPCDIANCTKPNCERTGYALGVCGCCNVCAKAVDEECRGIWNILGTCDKNLTCNSTREQIDLENIYPDGVCTDAKCKAIVDIMFAVDGSRSISESNFDNVKEWVVHSIEMLYKRYGACAHIGVVEYASSSEANFVSPFGLGECTNNPDCYATRMMNNVSLLDLNGAYTYRALRIIARDYLRTSIRFERSRKVIIVITDEVPLFDSTDIEDWKRESVQDKVDTYVIETDLSAVYNWSKLISGNGRVWSTLLPVNNETTQDMVDAIWDTTVVETVSCEYPEEYSPCKSSSCAPTCDEPYVICPVECDNKGCVCTEGYARLSKLDDTCVKHEDCPQRQCSYPEVYRACSKACNATCEDPTPICIEVCGPPRCECTEGYVWRGKEHETCIPRTSCPNECPSGRPMNCFAHACDVEKCPRFPDAKCRARCNGCIADFFDEFGNNVTEKCDECTFPEVYRECSSPCTATCFNPYPTCIERCDPPKCECAQGYVRSGQNMTCVPLRDCPGDQCTFPEVYRECSSPCTATCFNPSPICIQSCDPPKCECAQGYVRSGQNMTCIPLGDCSGSTNTTCNHPKIYQSCPPACHPTCDSLNPTCATVCGTDHCVCPVDHVLYSATDRRCVHEYECQAQTCIRDCPAIDMSVGSCSNQLSAEAWICQFTNWRCTTHDWKLSIEEWWFNNGCYALAGQIEARWRLLFRCPQFISAECTDASAYRYEMDAFGCAMSYCVNGKYRDISRPLEMWKFLFIKHNEMMQIYKEASASCPSSSDVGGYPGPIMASASTSQSPFTALNLLFAFAISYVALG